MLKSTKTRWLRKGVILYLVILVLIAAASFAWFLFDDTVTLQTQDTMVVTAGNKLEVSLLNNQGESITQFQSWIEVTTPNISFPDVTGDGLTLYFPKVLDEDDQPYTAADSFINLMEENADQSLYFITLRLQFRTTTPMDVYLADGSYVRGMDDLSGVNAISNPSAFGEISRDAIAGAARVAFIEYDPYSDGNNYQLKNVWVPNDTYQLSYRDVADGEVVSPSIIIEDKQIATFQLDGQRESEIGFLTPDATGKTMEFYSWTGGDYCNGTVKLGSTNLAKSGTDDLPMVNGSTPLLSFTEDDIISNDGIATKELIVRIWIEGTDREADKATVGGRMQYKFQFTGFQKTAYADSAEKENREIFFDSTAKVLRYRDNDEVVPAGKLLYSYDAITWSDYTNTLPPDANGNNAFIYLRYKETESTKASDAWQLALTPIA